MAEDAVAALAELTAASSTVLRDGRLTTVPSAELVPGDLLVLAEGTRWARTPACSVRRRYGCRRPPSPASRRRS
ncbi:hypothetical protein AUQ48_09200 [Kocuria flava]|uniref:P-type ATPase A domain-containing protein n=1 Tax=Kocuria flava TaxID=446860 RepID=A0A2N4T2C2_9MICC|nr:hypothetical protein AUQ48_09200 [Kocuria flava]